MILSIYILDLCIAQCTFTFEGAAWQLKTKIVRVPESAAIANAIEQAVDHATKSEEHYGMEVTIGDGVSYYAL